MLLVHGNDYYSPLLQKLPSSVKVLSVNEAMISSSSFSHVSKVCTTHEEAIESIRNKVEPKYNEAVKLFRNKTEFRLKLKDFYPNFYFKQITLPELSKQILNFDSSIKYIIKPVRGFFGIGVKIITAETDLLKLQNEIELEISGQRAKHPEYVKDESLSTNDFLIEEYIGLGDDNIGSLDCAEIAIDGYYNTCGDFILTSLYHHPYRADRKYFHMLYYTSEELYQRFALQIISFFNKLQKILNLDLRSFPLHAEFINHDKTLFPIEINPGRFAGLGLCDLNYYAFGVNPYDLFFQDKVFDWNQHWKKVNNKKLRYYAWILAYRGNSVKNKQSVFNHKKFKIFLGKGLLKYAQIDYDEEICSISYLKTTNKKKLSNILKVDLNNFLDIHKDRTTTIRQKKTLDN